MTSQPIWFDSTEAGAPSLNNAVGSMVEVLRACLVNGFGIKSISSITVASGVATVTSANHGFTDRYGKLVLIEGAPIAGLNGRKQPGGITTNTFTFPAPGVADGTYVGTISAKRAPLGWSEPYSATGKAIFARTDPAATAYMLRVDDTQVAPATNAEPRARIVESVTGIDSFSIVSPTEAQSAGGGRWYKGAPSATPMRWLLVGDELGFYFFLPSGTSQANLFYQHAVYFGDFNSYLPGDAHRCAIVYGDGPFASFGFPPCRLGETSNNFASGGPGISYGLRSARSFDGAAASPGILTLGVSAGQTMGIPTGQTSNTLMTVIGRPMMIMDNPTTYQIRGEWPGLANRLSAQAFDLSAPWSVVPAAQGDGRAYLEVRCTIRGSVERSMMLDLTGPWHD